MDTGHPPTISPFALDALINSLVSAASVETATKKIETRSRPKCGKGGPASHAWAARNIQSVPIIYIYISTYIYIVYRSIYIYIYQYQVFQLIYNQYTYIYIYCKFYSSGGPKKERKEHSNMPTYLMMILSILGDNINGLVYGKVLWLNPLFFIEPHFWGVKPANRAKRSI